MHRTAFSCAATAAVLAVVVADFARGGTYFIHPDGAITGGARWDAAPQIFGGNERSLDGGLRYSLQGGSYETFRDLIPWNSVPTVTAFQQAVEQAFAAWESTDPVTGLATDVYFVADLSTAVIGSGTWGTGNVNGAEIDILAVDAGFSNPRGEAFFGTSSSTVTLTSGTSAYPGSEAFTGADISINNNPDTLYSIDSFRRLLTHEIGHAIGLGDVDADGQGMQFVDDNYDGTTSATAGSTLTNSWALLVDPLNPATSTLAIFNVPDADPGVDTPGVDILMESNGLGASPANPVTNIFPLRNDDYGMRQFLYPSLTFDFPPGDFNHDGKVDAADYVTWRDGLGSTFVENDHNVWRAHFGNGTTASGVATNSIAAIPEPSWLTTWILAATMLACCRGCHC